MKNFNLYNGRNVVFVHGFNVTEREARGWNAEMFKRLWQSSCNAAYYAVTWRGDAGWPNGLFYHDDVTHAFETAPYLSDFVSSLHGDTTLMAHSLGNMVASSAIQDCNLEVARYFMLNAAVPAEAYDASQWNTNAVANRMLHPEWDQYEPRTWSSLWFQLFHNASDPRLTLSWKNRFGSVFYLTELYNFHSGTEMSPGDQMLEANAMTDAQLQTAPAFRRRPSKMFSSSIPYEDRCEILACGIPTLSGPEAKASFSFSAPKGLDHDKRGGFSVSGAAIRSWTIWEKLTAQLRQEAERRRNG